jgi:hypothetical protein
MGQQGKEKIMAMEFERMIYVMGQQDKEKIMAMEFERMRNTCDGSARQKENNGI